MRALYSIGIFLYYLVIRLLSLFGHSSASKWINGRKAQNLPEINANEKWIWFHAASLGEFEQGRPVMEAVRKQFPELKLLLTFYSPSGYEVRKNYALADLILYLPLDSVRNAKRFIHRFNPILAVFIKYEYWYNFLHTIDKNKIPYYFISAIYRDSQPFFRSYGGWFRKHLAKAEHIYCQNEESLKLLNSIGIQNASVSGDTRFDRVSEAVISKFKISVIEEMTSDFHTLIAGSTWPSDELILKDLLKKSKQRIKLILAPHLVDESHIREIENLFEEYQPVRYSTIEKQPLSTDIQVLIIDKIGLLLNLYQYGTFAYIGGGFGKGIHNVLEAAAFGQPVIFGPNYHKFAEAHQLIELKAGFTVKNSEELIECIESFTFNPELLLSASETSAKYVQDNLGATKLILNGLAKKIYSR